MVFEHLHPLRLGSLALLGLALHAHIAAAQCPDGSLPPCGRRSAPPPLDPNRLAILPFQVVLGSLVGTAGKFTVAASILNVPNGEVRVSPVQVAGTEDSLPALTAALATLLLGKAAGIAGTSSNDALRAYLDGMAAYRKSP